MKKIKIIIALACLGIWFPLTAHGGIYRVPLQEHNSILTIGQYVSLEVLSVSVPRDELFIEVEAIDGTTVLRVLPRGISATFRLIDTTPLPERKMFARSAGDTVLLPELFAAAQTTYLLTESELSFRPIEPHAVTIPLRSDASTAANQDGTFALSADPRALLYSTTVTLQSGILLPLPASLRLTSQIYQFDILDSSAINTRIPLSVKIKYTDNNTFQKRIYYFDKKTGQWKPLPSYNDVEQKEVTARLHLTFAPVAVFSNSSIDDGIASWYAYKKCLCAASRKYPKGATVRVTRLKTNESVVVRINDYGPEEFTGRIIDLDAVAFKKLGALRAGLIYVSVEPLK